MIKLPKLLAATEKVLADRENWKDLRELLIPGTSLGGARPKATVTDKEGNLWPAKFARQSDDYSVVQWEAVALRPAQKCGLKMAEWRLQNVAGKAVLLIKRFDRQGKRRIPFVSGMAMLNARDGESSQYSYLDLAAVIQEYSSDVVSDLRELWQRILFSVLIANTDDHLRNHGFIRLDQHGWTLSPLYDVNPCPDRPDYLQLKITDTNNKAELDLVLEVSAFFGISKTQAEREVKQMRKIMAAWPLVAQELGIKKAEITRMQTAFKRV